MITAIIFDFGNVLVAWSPDNVYRDYFGNEEKMLRFYKETGIHQANLEMDRGRPFVQILNELATQFPHYHEAIWLWQQRWPDMLAGPIAGSVEILTQLHQQGYPLYGLTNWSLETIPYALDRYPFFDYFRDIIISAKEGYIKPERRIYDILLQRNDLQAQQCLFIDDNRDNVAAAEKLGMSAIHFREPQQLRAALQSLNIKLSSAQPLENT
ncbi:MAG: HAD family phosphatase [Gammaproteobacteria bacterium]|nr:HAD family phosphatase [Gammaproteobacteria bacterium]MCP4475700.1 HAD family phosphatase [Gammaproteobacteria bacterium]